MKKECIIKNDICFIGGEKRTEMRSTILLNGLRKNHISICQIPIKYANSRQALHKSYKYHTKFWCILVRRIAYENIYTFFALLKNRKILQTSKFLFLSEYSNYIVFTVKIFALLYQKPIIFDAHWSLYYQRIIGTEDYPEDSVYAKVVFYIDKLSAICVDRYITLSVSYAQTLASIFKLKKEKFLPIYLGYEDANLDTTEDNRNIDILQLSWNQLFHGIWKTIDLIYAIMRKKKIKTVLTWSIRYKDIIKKQGLEKNIESRRLSDEEKIKYIKSTKIILGPMWQSRLNNVDFSTKMNEALAYWKVLVAQNTPSARELLQDGVNAILIDIDDLEWSAKRIIDILENTEARKRIEKNALKTYNSYLRPEIVVEELVQYIVGH